MEAAWTLRLAQRLLAGDTEGDERLGRRRGSAASGRTARKQPVTVVDMQPVPVIRESSSWPFAIASVRPPSNSQM